MTIDHILDTIFRASVYRAEHGISPATAATIAVVAVVVGLYLRRR